MFNGGIKYILLFTCVWRVKRSLCRAILFQLDLLGLHRDVFGLGKRCPRDSQAFEVVAWARFGGLVLANMVIQGTEFGSTL